MQGRAAKVGERFGKLIVLKLHEIKVKYKKIWVCVCDCGNETKVYQSHLFSGHTISCGCNKGGIITHGMTGTPTYESWAGMMRRCYNPKDTRYVDYGFRGIFVNERWHKFANFFEDMGVKPDGLTLERKNNSEGYSKDNCKWATYEEQNNNRRIPIYN